MLVRSIHRCLHLNRCLPKPRVRFYSETHYDVLGVGRKATPKQLQDAFLEKSKQLHPDKNIHDTEQHDKFVKLNEAYTTLSKPESRIEYDATVFSDKHGPEQTIHRHGTNVKYSETASKRGLGRVPRRRYYQIGISAIITGCLLGVMYITLMNWVYGRESELLLIFKSPDAMDEDEELEAAEAKKQKI